MRRCLPVALLLVLGSTLPVTAATARYHVGRRVYGCVDQAAAVALDGPGGRRADAGWTRSVERRGRCFPLWPALPLDIISRRAGMALVRRVPPRIGEPPLFVLERDLEVLRPAALPPPPAIVPVPDRPAASPGRDAPVVAEAVPQGLVQGAVPTVGGTAAPAGAIEPPGRIADGNDGQGPQSPVPAPSLGSRSEGAGPDPAAASPAATPPPEPVPMQAETVPPGTDVTAAPPTAAPLVVAPPPSPVAPPIWPPQSRQPPSRLDRDGFLIGLVLVLLLIGAVTIALVVARRRRHFAHVEEEADWPPRAGNRVVELRPAAPPVPTATEFRKHCAAALTQAGWATQLAFPGDGSGPDIVARRDAVVAAVRCRASNTAVTGEMVDEAAVMGTRHGATLTLLASNAPFSQLARDEADRHGIRLLRDTELAGFVG